MGEFGRMAGGGRAPAQPAISALDGAWELRSLTEELYGLLADDVLDRGVELPLDEVADEPSGRHALREADPTPIYHSLARGGWRSRGPVDVASGPESPESADPLIRPTLAAPPAQLPLPTQLPPPNVSGMVPSQTPPRFWDGTPRPTPEAAGTGRHRLATPGCLPDRALGGEGGETAPWPPGTESWSDAESWRGEDTWYRTDSWR